MMTKYLESISVCAVIFLLIASIVCIYLELYTSAILIFVTTFAIGLFVAYTNRISRAPVTPVEETVNLEI
jgi:membrane-bound ClpP family serine protease